MNSVRQHQSGKTAIIVLGSPNDSSGQLLPNALARIEEAVRLYSSLPSAVLVLTGGFGSFNATKTPHAEYLKAVAVDRGVPVADILTCPKASHTVDDAVHSLGMLAQTHAISKAVVVTSDFHVERARLIFTAVYHDVPVEFVGVDVRISPEEFAALQRHELVAISRLTNQRGVILGFPDRTNSP